MPSPDYLADRIPVTPLGLVIGDQIQVIHVEGDVDREIDVKVTSIYAALQDSGHYLVVIGHDGVIDGAPDSDDPLDATRPLRLDDPGMWISVAFPRPGFATVRHLFEVAA